MIILDTNVISEPLRQAPESRVIKWLDAQPIETLYLSAITVAELRFGLASLPIGKRRDKLQENLEKQVLPLFTGRVLSFDMSASQSYSELMAKARIAGLAISVADGYIAATAAANGMIVATRDVSLFEAAGVNVINPWEN
ncbi:type II toxin-antitoxin system VapC family toxin [Photorhabdus akhurstii]|uniref:type II toxin-antitoxin system VapC family toxin n=1 Tax=Photorhabdus akhurstii TaxID=171438 RepID=UPI001BD6B774|nr:type II toxin-antitoxin system VapC family toxin [Photorhabdus akhurstii]MBS9430658.1 type II toxin-antitoxin system VapC family toxin [Photorhabdus akhurstii]